MKKRNIHICMLHPQVQSAEELYKALHLDDTEQLQFEFIWDEKSPQFIIATDLIYTNPYIRQKFEKIYNENIITIFMAGECFSPDLNLFDYAICFDDYADGRVMGYAPRDFYREYITKNRNDLENNIASAKRDLLKKDRFCSFIYSNPKGHANREKIFNVINRYKKVDSLGTFLNNTGFSDVDSSSMLQRVKNSIAIKSRYKFAIAFENTTHTGYTSEKLFTSLEAHSIPIYWGNPEVGKIVNEKAIINCHRYDSFEQVLERVKEIDQDDSLWCRMASEPWFTKEQEAEEIRKKEKYVVFLNRIFLQDIKTIRKRASGTIPELYKKFFFGNNAEYEKCNMNYQLSMQWLQLHHCDKNLGDFFKDKKYGTVAVYGMGIMGVSVYEELLKCADIKSIYGIDKGIPSIPQHMRCLRLYEIGDALKPDAVIVTVLWDIDNIIMELNSIFQCEIYSIKEIIDDIMQNETGEK